MVGPQLPIALPGWRVIKPRSAPPVWTLSAVLLTSYFYTSALLSFSSYSFTPLFLLNSWFLYQGDILGFFPSMVTTCPIYRGPLHTWDKIRGCEINAFLKTEWVLSVKPGDKCLCLCKRCWEILFPHHKAWGSWRQKKKSQVLILSPNNNKETKQGWFSANEKKKKYEADILTRTSVFSSQKKEGKNGIL